jgi:hypothetical protein
MPLAPPVTIAVRSVNLAMSTDLLSPWLSNARERPQGEQREPEDRWIAMLDGTGRPSLPIRTASSEGLAELL